MTTKEGFEFGAKVFDAQVIVPHVWLGSSYAAYAKDLLLSNEITHILSIQDGYKPTYPEDFKYMVVLAHDVESQDLLTSFPFCFQFITDALESGGNVLVHCGAGVSRSPTLVIAYLMYTLQLSYEKSYAQVMAKRSCIYPNKGFEYQLKLWEEIGCNLDHIAKREENFSSKMGFFYTSLRIVQYNRTKDGKCIFPQ